MPVNETDLSATDAEDVLVSLRAAMNAMDETEVTTGSRILFITPTLKGVLDDFSLATGAEQLRTGTVQPSGEGAVDAVLHRNRA